MAATPEDAETVGFAFPGYGRFEAVTAERVSILPSGLSLYRFSRQSAVPQITPVEPKSGATFHAVRVSGEGVATKESPAKLRDELQGVEKEIQAPPKQGERLVLQKAGDVFSAELIATIMAKSAGHSVLDMDAVAEAAPAAEKMTRTPIAPADPSKVEKVRAGGKKPFRSLTLKPERWPSSLIRRRE